MRLDRLFRGKVQIYNEYGPTEATVGCAVYLYAGEKSDSVPIGHPIDNTVIYLLDKNGMFLSETEIGEIYISGESVAIGYHNEKKQGGFLMIRIIPGNACINPETLPIETMRAF